MGSVLKKFVINLLTFLVAFSSSENGRKYSGVMGDTGLNNFNFFDDQICLVNFDVSEGSIIRTKDSLSLGARYLNVSELGDGKNKDDCLRLCCKTPHCNVITFEEKRSGSCYMFDCGSIENFHCKFTDQPEFMSAILRKRVEPLLNLPPQVPNPNRHEVELSQLRNSETERARNQAGGNFRKMGEIEEVVGKEMPSSNFSFSLDKLDNFNGGSRRCSRYQFECKSSGECIGIYNACDGITQCPDGSDEAPELNCPAVNGRPGIVIKVTDPKQNGNAKSESATGGEPSSKSSQIHHELHSAAHDSQRAEISAMTGLAAGSTYDGLGNPTGGTGKNGNVVEVPPSQMDPNIFTHKNGGLMQDSYRNQLQQQSQRQNNPYNYWKSYDYVAEPPYSQAQSGPAQPRNLPFFNALPGLNQPNQAGNYNGQFKFPAYGDIPPIPYNVQTQMFPPLVQQQLPYNTFPNSGDNRANNPNAPDSNYEPTSNMVKGQNSIKTEATTVKPLLPATLLNTATTPKSIPSTQQPSTNPQSVVKLMSQKEIEDKILQSLLLSQQAVSIPLPQQLDIANLGAAIESEASDIPSPGIGAVMACAAGLTMSLVMVIVLTYRLRRVRMSSRRRGKNRLDPDYLVDGMYL